MPVCEVFHTSKKMTGRPPRQPITIADLVAEDRSRPPGADSESGARDHASSSHQKMRQRPQRPTLMIPMAYSGRSPKRQCARQRTLVHRYRCNSGDLAASAERSLLASAG